MTKTRSDLVRKGLYTDSKGKVVVNVYDSYNDSGWREGDVTVEFENVRTGYTDELSKSSFNKKFPHRIDKIIVEFSD